MLLTDDGYQSIQVKDLTAPWPTQFYYNPTFSNSLGTIIVWPVPSGTTASAVLYTPTAVTGFSNLTSNSAFPPGYNLAFIDNLAVDLSIGWRQPDPLLIESANRAFAILKRNNTKQADLMFDPALTSVTGGLFNIISYGRSGR